MDDNVDLKWTPVTLLRDIPQFVKNLLQEYKAQGNLIWHDGAIPADEVWIRLRGRTTEGATLN